MGEGQKCTIKYNGLYITFIDIIFIDQQRHIVKIAQWKGTSGRRAYHSVYKGHFVSCGTF